MTQFSIREALGFSFSTFRHHVGVLLVAGALVGLSFFLWQEGPAFVAKRVGVYMPLAPQDALNIPSGTEQSQMAITRIHEATQKLSMHLQTAPRHLLLLVLLATLAFLALHIFYVMALVRVALDLATKQKASFNDLFKAERVMTSLAAFAVFLIYFMCVILGAALLTVPVILVLKAIIGVKTAGVFGIISWLLFSVGVSFWAVGYMFFPFVLVDNAKAGARQSLSISQTITTSARLRLVGAIIVAQLVFGLMAYAGILVLGMVGLQDLPVVRFSIATSVIAPLYCLFLASIYNSIKNVKAGK